MKKRIRIKDIAKRAGVSTGTVDRVIHKRGNVSKKAEERVLAVMKELDYEPNLIASTLAYNRVYRVATLLPNFKDDPYWEQPKQGVEKAFNVVQYYNLVWEPHYFDLFDTEGFRKKARSLLASSPDAVLLAPVFLEASRAFIESCRKNHIPLVKINTNIGEDHALCYVGQDSYQSGVLAGKLLHFGLKGDESVMIINLDKETIRAQHLMDKEAGFRDFFARNFGPDLQVVKCEFPAFDDSDRLRAFMLERFQENPKLSGIFVTNSRAYKMLDSLGDAWPGHLKIVGFDLLEPNLRYLREDRISFLINQNPVQQGYQGIMNLTNHLLLKKEVEPMQFLPLDIVVRENYTYYLKREAEFQLVV